MIRVRKVVTIPARWTEMKPRLESIRLVDTIRRIWRHQRESWKQNNRKKFPLKIYFCKKRKKGNNLLFFDNYVYHFLSIQSVRVVFFSKLSFLSFLIVYYLCWNLNMFILLCKRGYVLNEYKVDHGFNVYFLIRFQRC